ncbi:MAG: DUF488 domain-containing protein [Nitrospirota bacterium]|nr:DUF488 domain-containing protein [Nitrospirota bacterium]
MHDRSIYTLGTSLRSAEDFIEILLSYGVSSVIDVRSFPRSTMPHFSKAGLSELLAVNGIAYHFLGKELGGFRKGGFNAYIITTEFADGVAMIESIAEDTTSVIICAERFPWKCHRKWIAGELRHRGWEVIHIIDKGKEWKPK